ncbi:ATP-binding cassette domain-containing protein [Cohnella sp. CFH 77786]|uniref:ABC transporter ATP-binding protein n=1 Tax=Cohnella sp. CFH 77786 TaxID=2662265 RepID=UPI001C60C190|nr:ABC transporter ATP-binding protein [Cohnella sp. CFH 77786]MBW5448826.1 ATP-binding cassette domain-containing protein [Cohnella sp. CFH 77786]
MPIANASAPAIQCDGLGVKIKKKTVLDNVGFTVESGSLAGLLGPNGAGKSTLMRILCGLLQPDLGTARVFGQPPGVETLGRMAFLPDRGKLPSWLTAREWLRFAEKLYPDWDMPRVPELTAALGVEPSARIGAMSRGEEARLQLLTCLARKAPLLILDEPFAGVDLLSRERIASAVIGEQADGNRTFLIATHDIREMESLFDRVVLIGGGTVRGVYDAEELRAEGRSIESCYRDVFA